jgi:hypothetical protein
MRGIRPPSIIWFAIMAAVFLLGWLSWTAITERAITTASRTGIHHKDELSAVVSGFFYLGAALFVLGLLAHTSRFKRLIWAGLALAWVLVTSSFFLFFY